MNAGASTSSSVTGAGNSNQEFDSGPVEVELIDGVPKVFLECLEDVFDNSNKLYLQLKLQSDGQCASPAPLHEKYNLELLISVLDDKGNARFSVWLLKSSPAPAPPKQTQFLVVTDRGDAILTVEQTGFMATRYEISGAGILGFSLRRTAFGNYVAFDKWKNLFKIHSWWLRLSPLCLAGPRRQIMVNILNLDGTWTGALAYNVSTVPHSSPDGGVAVTSLGEQLTSIKFAPGLNRKAKYIMFAACLIPFSSRFRKKR